MEDNFIKDDSLVAVKEENGRVEYTFQCEYASEALNYVPTGYIDKTVCGCGLTTVAIKEPCHTIIAVPNVSLVTNKAQQYPGQLLGVYGEVSKADIDEFATKQLEAGENIKIITTYDSLGNCEGYLNAAHLVIDECDRIGSYAALKAMDTKAGEMDAISKMLLIAEKHKKTVSFISATPIPPEVLTPYHWLTEIDQVVMHWPEQQKNVVLIECRDIDTSLLESLLIPLRQEGKVTIAGREITKVLVFYNSVNGIMNLITRAKLPSEEVYILCGDSIENDCKIGSEYQRVEEDTPLRKYNFFTSTGFQGIDLYDDEAISVLVSKPYNAQMNHCMLELNSDLKQASSRIRTRNNPYYNTSILYYQQAELKEEMELYLSKLLSIKQRIEEVCQDLNEKKASQSPLYTSALATYSYDREAFSPLSIFDHAIQKWKVNELVFSSKEYFTTQRINQFEAGKDIAAQLQEIGYATEQFHEDSQPYTRKMIMTLVKKKKKDGVEFTDRSIYPYILQVDSQLEEVISLMNGENNDTNTTRTNQRLENCLSREAFSELNKLVRKTLLPGHYTAEQVVNILKEAFSLIPELKNRQLEEKDLKNILNQLHIKNKKHHPNLMHPEESYRVPHITIKGWSENHYDGSWHTIRSNIFFMLGRQHTSIPIDKPKRNPLSKLFGWLRKVS